MHPCLVLSFLCLYTYLGLHVLPFLLTLSIGFALVPLFGGSLINAPPMSTRRKLMMASWKEPAEGTVYGITNINAEPLMEYLQKVRNIEEGDSGRGVCQTSSMR